MIRTLGQALDFFRELLIPVAGLTAIPNVTSNATFLSSLGVNVHIDQGYDPAKYVVPLQYTGIKNIRTGSNRIAGAIALHRQTGVMVNVFGSDLPVQLDAARQLADASA